MKGKMRSVLLQIPHAQHSKCSMTKYWVDLSRLLVCPCSATGRSNGDSRVFAKSPGALLTMAPGAFHGQCPIFSSHQPMRPIVLHGFVRRIASPEAPQLISRVRLEPRSDTRPKLWVLSHIYPAWLRPLREVTPKAPSGQKSQPFAFAISLILRSLLYTVEKTFWRSGCSSVEKYVPGMHGGLGSISSITEKEKEWMNKKKKKENIWFGS